MAGPDDMLPDGDRGAGGEPASARVQFDQIYTELRQLAQARLRSERRGHTLQATALVNEVWLRLGGRQPADCGGRRQFFAAAIQAMRRILIDHARRRGAERRGAGRRALPLGRGLDLASAENVGDALVLDDLVCRLEKEDAPAAQVVRLRFFAGLSIAETAAMLGVSAGTVKNHWTYARAWLADAWEERADDGIRSEPRP